MRFHSSIPLCFIYPPLLHLRACAHSKKQRILDYLLLLFGLVAAVYTTLETAKVLVAGKRQGGTQFGKCD
jgi:proton-coupled amino acid transporter